MGLLIDMVYIINHTYTAMAKIDRKAEVQTFLVTRDFHQSARCLDPKRLFSQIYEGIHILASLRDMESQLVNPKRNVAGHPIARMWEGHEPGLYSYCLAHYDVWSETHGHQPDSINYQNLLLLSTPKRGGAPIAVVDRIGAYRALLMSKDPVFYSRWGW